MYSRVRGNSMVSQTKDLLVLENVKKYFPVHGKPSEFVRAVDDVSLRVKQGSVLGIVGESGCGKSTLARLIMRLIEPTSGSVFFEGKELTALPSRELRKIRRNIQIIFQDPYASLNPRQRIGKMLKEPLKIHRIASGEAADRRARELVEMVGMNADSLDKFPHEFSGGQRQRLCIARALAVEPKLLICDECVSALDVSIQAQIVNLLKELQKQLDLTMIFVSHDLRVVKHISSDVAVMYLGRVLETAPKKELFDNTCHPYSKVLLGAVPVCDPTVKKERIFLQGDLPSPIHQPSGCKFHTRCYQVREECKGQEPLLDMIEKEHYCRCPYWEN